MTAESTVTNNFSSYGAPMGSFYNLSLLLSLRSMRKTAPSRVYSDKAMPILLTRYVQMHVVYIQTWSSSAWSDNVVWWSFDITIALGFIVIYQWGSDESSCRTIISRQHGGFCRCSTLDAGEQSTMIRALENYQYWVLRVQDVTINKRVYNLPIFVRVVNLILICSGRRSMVDAQRSK